MKYTATILMSLLLLGVCSARILYMSKSQEDDMKRKDDSQMTQDYRRDSEENKSDDQKSEQWAQLKETVSEKLRTTYQKLTSLGNIFTPLDRIPQLTDPIEVGTVVDKYVFGSVNYDRVQFTGLRGVRLGALNINTHSHEAILTIQMQNAEIRGFYEASDLVRKTSGDFSIKMSKNVSFECTYPYNVQGGNVQLQESTGQLYSENWDSHYDNIGFFAQFLQNALGRELLRTVNEKVHHELHSKLSRTVQNLIENAAQNEDSDSVEKAMREDITKAISGIQQVVSKHGGFSIDLKSDEKEMVHDRLHARISSVKLNGIEKFYMFKNSVSQANSDSDKIRAKVELAIDRPTATAFISLHEAHDQDAPFQKINVDFEMEELMAELSLDKSTRRSGLELRSVKTKLNRIRPMNTEKYEGRVSSLVKEQMPSHMRRYIERGLKNFLEKELSSIMSQGAQPQSQE